MKQRARRFIPPGFLLLGIAVLLPDVVSLWDFIDVIFPMNLPGLCGLILDFDNRC